jgi:carbon-monoxide dehydrogenase large subunit
MSPANSQTKGKNGMSKASNRLIGAPLERYEDLRFLRGRGTYIADLQLEGMLHAVVVRSAVAHGRIRRVDAAAALAIHGVHAVFTADDLGPAVPRIPIRLDAQAAYKPFEQPVIATGKVRYVGEPIALVIADSQAIAEDAAEAVAVDIEPLQAVVEAADALAGAALLVEEAGSNSPATIEGIKGDADAAFATAPYARRERFRVHRHSAVPMEPRGLVATWDAARRHLTLYGAAKVPYHNRRTLAALMDLPETAIDLVENDVGGGFGVRGEFYPEDFLIPFAAMKLGRPVRWLEDRREHLMATNHAREAECEIEIACERDGRMLALRAQSLVNMGAYIRTTGSTPPRNIAQVLPGPYRIEQVKSVVTLIVSNKTPSGTYRAPGRFEADFFRERMIDLAARDLGLDPIEMRRRNLVREADMPWPMPTVVPLNIPSECDSGDHLTTFERCLAEFGWSEKAPLQGSLIDGRRHGIAAGCYLEGAGSGKESARLTLEPDGRVMINVGSSAIGQGVETIFRQIVGDLLELPLERIAGVQHGSTGLVLDGGGAFSSRSTVMAGSALAEAAETLKASIRKAAAGRLDCAEAEIEIADGAAEGPGGARFGFDLLAADVPPADGVYSSPKRTYSYGTHAVHVAVDPGTGRIEVLAYAAVEDVGRIVNPETLHGQALGAIVQGLGGTILEHLVYDGSGQLLTGSFADYLLPTAGDFPRIDVHATELYPSPNNPLGAKGAGEGGTIPVGGLVANAVANAIGAEPYELPLSPERVWQLAAGSRQS